ncbi:MAG: hypothetical protein AAFV49_10485 [Pseudomonadota bacterium]
MPNETRIAFIMNRQFGGWAMANYSNGYAWLKHPKRDQPTVATQTQKDADRRLHAACNAMLGKRKSTAQVIRTGQSAYNNGAGVCTTSAFAVAARLLADPNVNDRIEIMGQAGGINAGHMWVVVGRVGGTTLVGNGFQARRRPANAHANWGPYIVCDAWLQALGWKGFWKTPQNGQHHRFITPNHNALEIVYDSNLPGGDP